MLLLLLLYPHQQVPGRWTAPTKSIGIGNDIPWYPGKIIRSVRHPSYDPLFGHRYLEIYRFPLSSDFVQIQGDVRCSHCSSLLMVC